VPQSDQQRQSRDQSAAMSLTAKRFERAGHKTEARRLTGVAAMLAAHAAGETDPAKLRAANRAARA
jgi:hypothetical protein